MHTCSRMYIVHVNVCMCAYTTGRDHCIRQFVCMRTPTDLVALELALSSQAPLSPMLSDGQPPERGSRSLRRHPTVHGAPSFGAQPASLASWVSDLGASRPRSAFGPFRFRTDGPTLAGASSEVWLVTKVWPVVSSLT